VAVFLKKPAACHGTAGSSRPCDADQTLAHLARKKKQKTFARRRIAATKVTSRQTHLFGPCQNSQAAGSFFFPPQCGDCTLHSDTVLARFTHAYSLAR